MMKKLLLALGMSLAVLPAHADELTPTTAKDGGVDLPPPRTVTRTPAAAPAKPMPVEVAPVEVVPQPSPVIETPPAPAVAPAPVAAPAKVTPAAPAVAVETTPMAPAAPVATAPMARGDDTGWFAGLGLGYSNNKDYECTGCPGAITNLDDSGFAYKIFGGYRLHRNFALSAGYMKLADTDAASTGGGWTDTVKVDGFYGAGHGILPVTDKIDVFATLGLLRWHQKVTYSPTGSGSFDGTDLMYGLGTSYSFAKQGPKLQLEWNRLPNVGTNDPSYGHKDDFDLFTLNLVYQF